MYTHIFNDIFTCNTYIQIITHICIRTHTDTCMHVLHRCMYMYTCLHTYMPACLQACRYVPRSQISNTGKSMQQLDLIPFYDPCYSNWLRKKSYHIGPLVLHSIDIIGNMGHVLNVSGVNSTEFKLSLPHQYQVIGRCYDQINIKSSAGAVITSMSSHRPVL